MFVTVVATEASHGPQRRIGNEQAGQDFLRRGASATRALGNENRARRRMYGDRSRLRPEMNQAGAVDDVCAGL